MDKPLKIHDTRLGEIRYTSSMDWYETEVDTKYGQVSVSLLCEEYEFIDALVSDLRGFCQGLDHVLEKAFVEIAKTMVPLKNNYWLDNNEAPITGDILLAKVKSQGVSISLCKGGLAEMFFGDGGFFGGHSIVVWHNEDGTVEDAHLAG